jgi:hypothetical protein
MFVSQEFRQTRLAPTRLKKEGFREAETGRPRT